MPDHPVTVQPQVLGAPEEAGHRRRIRRRRRVAIAAGVVLVLVLAVVAYAGTQYESLVSGIKKSTVVAAGAKSTHGDTNILVMGLDSRLDENGKPLPQRSTRRCTPATSRSAATTPTS